MSHEIVVVHEPRTDVLVSLPAPHQVLADDVGVQGPPGPPGASAGEVQIFDWTTPTTSVTVDHNLGRQPDVTIIIGGEKVSADVNYPIATSRVVVNFGSPQGPGRLVLL